MAINAATAANLFNKAGYRLVSKVTGQVLPKMPEGAVSKTTCIIEHISGKKQAIHRYLNAQGKAVQINRVSTESNIGTLTDYKWIAPQKRTSDTAMYREKVDHYAFENYGASRNTLRYDRKTMNILENSDTVVDIHAPSRTVTKSFASRTTPTGNALDGFTDQAQLTQIVNGKKTKEIYQRSTGTPNSINTVVETTGFGVTKEELKQATSNPYFYAMFKNSIQMAKAAKTRAFENQGIPQDTPFVLTPLKGYGGVYRPQSNKICLNATSIKQGWHRSMIASSIEHEARHKWQYMLVEKLDKGLLTNPKEIKMAKEFKHNFANYIPKSKGYEAYESQPIEADAYKTTDIVGELYSKSVDYLQQLFPRAARRTLGE